MKRALYTTNIFKVLCLTLLGVNSKLINSLLLTSCPSMFSTSNSPSTTRNPGFGATQPRLLGLLRTIQWAAVNTHSRSSRDPPQKMKSSSSDWIPTCHGQSRFDAISPPTIRLLLGRPQFSEAAVAGGTEVVGETDVAVERKASKKNKLRKSNVTAKYDCCHLSL